MMKYLGASFLTILLFALLLSQASTQTDTQEIKAKERELERLRREIEEFEQKIKKSEEREKSTLETLDYYDRQSLLLRRRLRKLKDETGRLQKEIQEMQRNIGQSENRLRSLRSHYARYVESAYKYGRLYDLELLLTSKSINQFAIRIEYLRRFTNQRKKDIGRIKRNISNLEDQSEGLQAKLSTQQRLVTEKTTEELRIKKKSQERKKLLTSIKRSKDSYKKELQRKTKAATELEKIIVDLIERDRIRRAREAELARRTNTPSPERIAPGLPFPSRQGRLPWPVSGGAIVSRYGNQIHPVLKTVTQNTGIDISVPAGTDVRAVADADVAVISWLPSYGNLIILNHNNGFRTVYAHLSEIFVTQGQRVNEAEVIGKSGESISGSLLHFELWKEREKQDPEVWLGRR